MVRFCIFFLCCLAGASLFAQPTVSAGRLLASAVSDPAVLGAAGHLDVRRQTNRSLPWIERVEFRTETNRFELQRQEYLSRFSVNGMQEKRAYQAMQNAGNNIARADQMEQFHEALAWRYGLLAAYRRVQVTLALRQELGLVYADRIRVLRQLMAAGVKTDVDDLMKAEFAYDELQISQMEDTATLKAVRRDMAAAMYLDTLETIDTTGQLHPLLLASIVNGDSDTALADPEETQYAVKIQALESEYRLEKAESAQVLDFFQMRYGNRPNEPWRNDVSLSLGFRLPYSGSGKTKMAEIAVEQHAVETELERRRLERARALRAALQHLSALEQQYLRQQALLSESERRYDLTAALSQGPDGILALLQFREMQLKQWLRLEETAADMFDTYLLILDVSGRLSAVPLVNYWSATLEEVKSEK